MNGIKRTVAGVMPPGARWPLDADIWVPLRYTTEQDPDLQRRDNFIYAGVARLKDGVSLEQTRAVMGALAGRVRVAEPLIRKDITTVPTPVMESLVGATTPRVLWMLLGAVGFLLLIGCVNAANLQLARATARHRELAVRLALGAGRWRIVREAFLESGMLSLAGGGLGFAIARGLVRIIVAGAPAGVPRIGEAAIDLSALGFAFAASIGVAILFGVVPAVHAASGDPQAVLAEGSTRSSGGRRGTRTRRALVVVELALSVILLVGAGGLYLGRSMVAEGRDPTPFNETPVQWVVATPGYLSAIGVPMTRGRDFTARDDSTSPPVMIVNEYFAKAVFRGEDPIGKRAMSSRDEKVEREIVGVVHNVRYFGASDSARAIVYVPYSQNNAWHQGILTVRTRNTPAAALAAINVRYFRAESLAPKYLTLCTTPTISRSTF